MIGNHPKRRKTDKLPPAWAREIRLQELCNRQDEELQQLRAENARLRAQAANTGACRPEPPFSWASTTQPMGLAA